MKPSKRSKGKRHSKRATVTNTFFDALMHKNPAQAQRCLALLDRFDISYKRYATRAVKKGWRL